MYIYNFYLLNAVWLVIFFTIEVSVNLQSYRTQLHCANTSNKCLSSSLELHIREVLLYSNTYDLNAINKLFALTFSVHMKYFGGRCLSKVDIGFI